MAEPAKALRHAQAEHKDDAALQADAEGYLAEQPSLQILGELLVKLRVQSFPWWTPDRLRSRWSAAARMAWLGQRPDVRQQITSALTGLAARAARRMEPELQANLIDAVINEGDISALDFEDEFDPSITAVYGPAPEFWRQFREWLPVDQDVAAHQELMAWMLRALLADKSSLRGSARKPILTHWELRTAIPMRVWQSCVPIDVRVAIDEARLAREHDKPARPFHAVDELSIATPEVLAVNVRLRDLSGVLDAAERAMGFERVAELRSAARVLPVERGVEAPIAMPASSSLDSWPAAPESVPARTDGPAPVAKTTEQTKTSAEPPKTTEQAKTTAEPAKTVEQTKTTAEPAKTVELAKTTAEPAKSAEQTRTTAEPQRSVEPARPVEPAVVATRPIVAVPAPARAPARPATSVSVARPAVAPVAKPAAPSVVAAPAVVVASPPEPARGSDVEMDVPIDMDDPADEHTAEHPLPFAAQSR